MKLNLSQAFDLFKIQEAFLNAEKNLIGDTLRIAVQQNRTKEAIQMVKDQVALGNLVEIEMTIGASALNLINRI